MQKLAVYHWLDLVRVPAPFARRFNFRKQIADNAGQFPSGASIFRQHSILCRSAFQTPLTSDTPSSASKETRNGFPVMLLKRPSSTRATRLSRDAARFSALEASAAACSAFCAPVVHVARSAAVMWISAFSVFDAGAGKRISGLPGNGDQRCDCGSGGSSASGSAFDA